MCIEAELAIVGRNTDGCVQAAAVHHWAYYPQWLCCIALPIVHNEYRANKEKGASSMSVSEVIAYIASGIEHFIPPWSPCLQQQNTGEIWMGSVGRNTPSKGSPLLPNWMSFQRFSKQHLTWQFIQFGTGGQVITSICIYLVFFLNLYLSGGDCGPCRGLARPCSYL